MQSNMLESKSLLAKLMATENIHIEQQNVPTASFDVANRILVVPVLDKNISSVQYDLFMGHESGHALFTPLDGLKKAHELQLNSSICNVLEDVRIERKMKYKYPGLRSSFVKAYRELYDKDFFGTDGADLQTMNFVDRINLYTKVGTSLGIRFTEFERTLLDEIESTETYDDVLVVAKKVIDYMKEQHENEKEQNDEQEEEDEENFQLDAGMDDSDEEEEWEDEESSGSNGYGKEDLGDGFYNFSSDPIRSFTDEAYNENQQQLFEKNSVSNVYVNIPKINPKEIIFDYKDFFKKYDTDECRGYDSEGFVAIRNSNNKAVSYLVKEFEMRKNAEQMKRASVAKTGDLNMNKVFSYNFNDDIFKKMTIVPQGKSHGLVMFLDWSGSMSHHLYNTLKQLFALTMFCKKVNIPFEVYAFIGCHYTNAPTKGQTKFKENDIVFGASNFYLLNILSSRMSAAEYTKAGTILTHLAGCTRGMPQWMALGNTPLNETVMSAFEIVPQFKQKYKLNIVNTVFLTDGEGHSLRQCMMNQNGVLDNKSFGYKSNNPYRFNTVICDPVTRNQEKIMDGYSSSDQTKALIKLLKQRTNSNVVGFFVLHGREFGQEIRKYWPAAANPEALKSEFRKNKYIIAKNSGYDEYYFLKSESLDTDEDTELEVKENATTRGLVTAFKKYAGARVNNRVVLNRFIGLIA